jgi:hypothetical protein
MYSWKTIRTICAVLLIIPILHLAYLLSRELQTAMHPGPEAWADEVAAYAQSDQLMRLPKDPIVVIGGRRVKLWQGLEDLLSPQPVLRRGLGNATVNDITHYHSQLIGHYHPLAVVLLPGGSEFHIRDNKSADDLTRAIRKLAELDSSYEVTRQLYVFTPLKTPRYPGDNPVIDETTVLLQRWAETEDGVTILDANALLAQRGGRPNPDYYRIDGINLNEHGYLRLSLLLKNRLEQDAPQLHALNSAR